MASKAIQCAFCGKDFEKRIADINASKRKGYLNYCCAKCANDSRRVIRYNKCLYCGEETVGKNIFCNQSHAAKYNNAKRGKKTTKCLSCGKETHNDKYCSRACSAKHRRLVWIENWKSGINSGTTEGRFKRYNTQIKRYMMDKQDSKCSICGWGEVNINSNTIQLEIHHIDGNWKNNREENIMLICPNCHSLTDNHCGHKKGGGRDWETVSCR